MIGFSAGGSYALSVAADKQADWIDPLLLFSPFYSLDGIPPIRKPEPIGHLKTERDWDHLTWRQPVFAFRCRYHLIFLLQSGMNWSVFWKNIAF